ncbi:viral protein 1 [Betapolyomavirus callosciuri]|uniref:Major capsid protein VP1 n=1 Tax=Betapolyomavirus callosciuri TaxID=2721749 RepID=A0A6G9LX10_9POLY|nr:viral protein 1 [Betapolyomavirus callosciuri]QIQ69378.1 viral protein 1 [Betapolyomavirus callosciuri]QIQ69384.1 viral protein 1 [Betapolyomavirus callosciuri]QIQ69390.1 viral protein 1 [Betapolyomavirus callosciuri]
MACKAKGKGRPVPAQVPKLVQRGGVEILGLRTGTDCIYKVEVFLNPRMGDKDFSFAKSTMLHSAVYEEQDKPAVGEIPTYSVARVQLPIINEDMTCEQLYMWEAVACKTEVVGVPSLMNHHSGLKKQYANGPGIPIEGPSLHFFSVGGEPLEVQAVLLNFRTTYEAPLVSPGNNEKTLSVLNPKNKAVLDKDGVYPVEVWSPDPSRNENTRYFGHFTGGPTTPPVLQYSNTVTTVLLDQDGVGPLCKGDGLFLTCADICGMQIDSDSRAYWRGLPRYFEVTLRQRVVKNPYPVSTLLTSLFNGLNPRVEGQPMSGDDNQVEEVRVFCGTEAILGDPDLKRFSSQLQPACPPCTAVLGN